LRPSVEQRCVWLSARFAIFAISICKPTFAVLPSWGCGAIVKLVALRLGGNGGGVAGQKQPSGPKVVFSTHRGRYIVAIQRTQTCKNLSIARHHFRGGAKMILAVMSDGGLPHIKSALYLLVCVFAGFVQHVYVTVAVVLLIPRLEIGAVLFFSLG